MTRQDKKALDWLELGRELQALAQTGLHYSQQVYDRERYERIRDLAAEILAAGSNLSPQEILCWQQQEFGYATPKVDVRGFILRAERILLVRENADRGRWTLPGGWADVNQSAAESAVREVEEESGYQARVVGLLAALDREKQGHEPPFPYHAYKLFFHCEIIGGAPRANYESSESGFFSPDHLPELSLSRVTARQLQRFYAKIKAGDLSADFD